MAAKDIVVIGASAGGMEALQELVRRLPADFPASIFIVWHLPPATRTILPEILAKTGPLPAGLPEDGDPIEPGRIYVAPNDHHMLLERGYIRIARGPKENRFRPAIDALFRSAAYVYNSRVVGVVLSGALDDGTAGLWTIKLRGGTAIVQEPAEAMVRSMPLNALDHVTVDHRLPAAEIGALLGGLVRETAAPPMAVPANENEKTRREVQIAKQHEALEEALHALGELTPFTCPECHGVLSVVRDGSLARFRCHTGHAFSTSTLLMSSTSDTQARLWDAVRAMDETVFLLNRLGEQFASAGNTRAAERCFDKARETHEHIAGVRQTAMDVEDLDLEKVREKEPGRS